MIDLNRLADRMFEIDSSLSMAAKNWNHNLAAVYRLVSKRPDKAHKIWAKFDPSDWIRRSSGHIEEIQNIDPSLANAIMRDLESRVKAPQTESLHKIMQIKIRNLRGLIREAVRRGRLQECGDTPCAPCAAKTAARDPYGEDAFAYDMLMAGEEDFIEEDPGPG